MSLRRADVDYVFFFFKQKTAYEMCGRDWSSDVCSSDLVVREGPILPQRLPEEAEAAGGEATPQLHPVHQGDRKSVV